MPIARSARGAEPDAGTAAARLTLARARRTPMTTNRGRAADTGLDALLTLLHLQGVAADRDQLKHRPGTAIFGAAEIIRCAKDLSASRHEPIERSGAGCRARPLPAIAMLRDGSFMVIAKASDDKVLVQSPQAPAPGADDARRAVRDLGRRPDPDDPARRALRPRRAVSTSPGSSARSANTAGCSARCWSPRSSSSSSRWSRRCSSRS